MSGLDLDQKATAMWFDAPAPPGGIAGANTRPFDTLEGAVRFIMEELPPLQRGLASIRAGGDTIDIEEIEAIFRQLPPPPSRVDN